MLKHDASGEGGKYIVYAYPFYGDFRPQTVYIIQYDISKIVNTLVLILNSILTL